MDNDLEILTAAQLRAKYFPSTSEGEDKSLLDYLEELIAKGIMLNPKLFPSKFLLKNGLPYTGMAVREEVKGGEVLIRVPQDLIMSSDKAMAEPELSEVYKQPFFFYKHQPDVFEDRVLIVYSLFLLHKKEESNTWYQMVKRFPQECDIACFWPEEELSQFKDLTVKNAALINLSSFEQQWSEFVEIQKKHEILQNEAFNKNDYRRVYITLSNRAFGYQVKYVSLVPMAEYFNHHSSKVYYSLEKKPQTYIQDTNEESQRSSIGSCDSQQFIQEEEFAYEKFQVAPTDWDPETEQTVNETVKANLNREINLLLDKVQEELNWKDFTVLFVGHLIYKIKMIRKVFLEKSKPYDKAIYELSIVKKTLDAFKKQVTVYYKEQKSKDYIPKKVKTQTNKDQNKFQTSTLTKEYQSLIIKTTKFDNIQKNNQIYFRYGHNCNRTLLLNYGFAIEGNKYEHFETSFNVVPNLEDFPDVVVKLKEKQISLVRKFKVYHHRLNMDLIIFFRLNNWTFYGQKAINEIFSVVYLEKQIAIIEQIVSILEQYLQAYNDRYDLTDKSLNYHEYFRQVYHIEKQNILNKQIYLFNLIIEILNKIEQGTDLSEATKNLTSSQRKVLEPYIKTIQL